MSTSYNTSFALASTLASASDTQVSGLRSQVSASDTQVSGLRSQVSDSAFSVQHLALSTSYVLITPARNEAAFIGQTIDSVTRQSIPPLEWVIVSDGSTDDTDKLVLAAAEKHPWIRLLRLNDSAQRGWNSVVFALEAGIRHLQTADYHFLGFLDADVRFPEDYFARLMSKFVADPKLGLGGGHVIDFIDGRYIHGRHNHIEVAGASHFFRRECFATLGGLFAIPEGGWDTLTAACARMNGYTTATFPDLVVDHLKPRNVSEGHPFRRRFQMGRRDYAVGNHFLWEIVKCGARIKESPFLFGTIARFVGYCTAPFSPSKRLFPKQIARFIQKEQLRRLLRLHTEL